MSKILRDPLFHFTALGLLLFILFALFGAQEETQWDDHVRVDRDALLTFIQYRTRSFEPELAERRLAALDDAALNRLVDEYVREEVLYREGLSLGLDGDDYVIRRRLIQKVEFLAEGFAGAAIEIDEAGLNAFFEEHRQDYYIAPSITFTHVFFDKARHGAETVNLATAALARLNAEQVPFSGAPGQGDRFPFHVNYVERTPEFIASHFGAQMAEALFALPPEAGVWKGVFTSAYGAHLVMVTENVPGREAELDDVRARVREEAVRQRVSQNMEAAIAEIIARYSVDIDIETGTGE